jgi:hypothetical protein
VVLDGHAGRRMLGRCRSRLSHFPKTYADGAGSSESNPAPPRPDPLRVWAQDRSVLRGLWRLHTFVCVRGVSAIPHIYTSVLQALAGRGRTGRLEGGLQGYRDGAMHYLGYGLPRISILRGWVNRGPGDRPPARLRSAGTFLTAAVTAALVARQPAAFADAIILHSFSPPSVTASRHPQKLTSSQ